MKKLTVALSFLCAGLASAQEIKKDSVEASKQIQEVLIKAQRKKQYTDHAAYTFDQEALDRAMHSKDLLETLPELQLDPMSNTIKSIKGGKTLFLVNGIEATDNQIKSIAPTNVVRVLYYDIPPARWANRADTVVNIITRNPEVGYSYGAEAMGAFTTGFLNGAAYAGYTKGKHDFGLEYSINYRDYDNRVVDEKYEYQLNGVRYVSDARNKDHFGYTYQDISARYAYVDANNLTFQAKFTVTPVNNFANEKGESLFTIGNSTALHNSIENKNSNYTNPTLDLYFSKNLGKKDELIFNVVGSHFTTNSYQFNKEWNVATGVDVFNNDMHLKAKQTGLVGEVAHTHQFEKGKLTSGYRITNTAISNDLQNLLGHSKFDVNYLQQYLYTEYSGKWEKFSFRLGMGITNIYNKNVENKQNIWVPTPKIVLSYPLANNQSLRLSSSYTTNSPSASALSANVVQVAPNLVRRGNPLLKAESSFRNQLTYSINSKYIDINATAFYNNWNKGIFSFYKADAQTGGYALISENVNDFQIMGLSLSGTIKPFGSNILMLQLFAQPVRSTLTDAEGKVYKNQYLKNDFSLVSQYKSWTFAYQFNLPVYSQEGSFLSTNENKHNLYVQHQYKSWKFTTGMTFIGMPARYKTKTLEGSPVQYNAHTRIFNNQNMFILGVGYDFSLGKKQQIQKKLQNQTQGAVSF
ncbi:TonB-dependent receptor plug domain-containing protein [Bergeyella zoohelcum]|uniref:Outer membrane protein beta-barrel domain-containing protein n=1 Tax=Bergeyella zoohelcum TaxID=1015 RepID=A0A7Z9CF70_9FLAO|nr:outer membrane beta-barrel protein [Bergeyella zoohelcum]VDH03003.1 Uncharacterised protein [Bergeyella zoohelcum]